MKKVLYLACFFVVGIAVGQDYNGAISNYLNSNQAEAGLQNDDITDFTITSQSFSKSMQLENVYVTQRYQGIDVFNTSSSFAVKEGSVVTANVVFAKNVSNLVNTTNPVLTAEGAIQKAASLLGISSPVNLELIETKDTHSFEFSKAGISLETIPVQLGYLKMDDNSMRLAWHVAIYTLDASHYYNVKIDAVTGTMLDNQDLVLNCSFGEANHSHASSVASEVSSVLYQTSSEVATPLVDGSQYRVFPLPAESPNHGAQGLVTEPANPDASPFGWHDIDGADGADFTITRGNNVYAYDDIGNNNSPGSSPDGGADLDFDISQNADGHPINNLDAAIVNLFYMNNQMHDIWYNYGFDEASGNFQENVYGNGGNGSDSVNAEAQDGLALNNANFSLVPDGVNGRMQMFLWNAPATPVGGDALTINNGPLAGDYFGTPATFGTVLPPASNPLTGTLALLEDDDSGVSTDPNDACDPVINAAELNGNIAVLRRGECEFGFKVLAAENAGAIAVIVVNNVADTPIVMGPGANGAGVTIPSIMVTQADGEALILALMAGDDIEASLMEVPPYQKDGSLDNGIIAHEYGHGISSRLTGGRFNPGCLQNQEQMGEGWSDWFGLMITIEDGDQGADPRGIGTYVVNQAVDGIGIRPTQYSTDMSINGSTYEDLASLVNDPSPHATGYLWATMLWDLTWAFIDEYGYDDDLLNGTGGNNIAMQLVIDGLKLQGCSPGFVDGRDAILLADEMANNGDNRCLIWEVFARRGVGVGADQGSSNSRADQTISFDVPSGPNCTLSVEDRSQANNFMIYPNPTNGQVNIRAAVDAGETTISIFDINGRKVYEDQMILSGTVTIEPQNLKTGVYILQLDGETYSQTSKLIVN
ncbi:T9SS-dependent M36 family metallopeptidase [Cochleicola gelatinilyticus]|uniref:Peptidase n=1 Tax=Cochleicola gelatinilyticus TaxID=1763537 RepID=A0A167J9T8_9FLAO|nr:T9SS-dependent M36 family metallopeptidase [Cochleicola gelatinilyticus]OAB80468.1 hypothetical protein ULVI_06960 [Cochleicola gelatinilyticus]